MDFYGNGNVYIVLFLNRIIYLDTIMVIIILYIYIYIVGISISIQTHAVRTIGGGFIYKNG